MDLRRKVLRGSVALSGQALLSQALRFVRNVIIARMLSPEDFGIAATLWLTATLVGMISDLGVQRLIVQADDGDEESFAATAQALFLVRGLLIGAVVFLLARPMAMAFKTPSAELAFQLAALLPVIAGLRHCDLVRFERHMRFGPLLMSTLIPEIVTTLAAWPVAFWVRNYWTFVILVIARAVMTLVLSHLLSERRFRLGWDGKLLMRFLHFGWPLLVNGLLMYGILHGDRWLIGMGYTMADLGVYSVAFTLAMTPTLLVANISGKVMLPVLSRVQGDLAELESRYTLIAQTLAMIAAAIVIPFIIAGGELVAFVYGSKYAAAGGFIGWLAAMQMVRLIRGAQATAAIALGDTRNPMIANMFRSLALIPALFAAVHGFDLVWIAISGFAGEVLAFLAGTARLYRRHGISLPVAARAAMIPALAALTAGIVKRFGIGGSDWLALTITTALILAVTCIAGLLWYDRVRGDLLPVLRLRSAVRNVEHGSITD